MKFTGICIETSDAPRLAAFYETVFQEEPLEEGNHYYIGNLEIYNPGIPEPENKKNNDKKKTPEINKNNIWIQCLDADIDELYERLLDEIPGIEILKAPEKKPWGVYTFWFCDPDGNRVAVAQKGVKETE